MSIPPSGYDKRRFANCTTEEFDCFICTEVSKKPKQCESCLKVFCTLCIDDWFKKSQECPYRCDKKYKIKGFKSRDQERIYNNLNLECQYCKEYVNILKIEQHEKECQLPKCQNYENCFQKITNPLNSLSKMHLCSSECQFFLNILNSASNQSILYKEIINFMTKNYPNIDAEYQNNKSISDNQIIRKAQSMNSNYENPVQIQASYPYQPQFQMINQNKQNLQLTWDPLAMGQNIQISKETSIQLKEQAYIFRTAMTKQCFTSGMHYWEIELNEKTENEMKIGVSLKQKFDYNTAFCDHDFGFAYYGIGQLRSKNNCQGSNYGQKFKNSGIIGVFLDMNKGQISYSFNGKFLGIAFNDKSLKTGSIYPAVALLHVAACTITYKENIPSIFPQ